MKRMPWATLLVVAVLTASVAVWAWTPESATPPAPEDRREVVFWHLWGGEHRAVVEGIVAEFNASQSEHFVRAIAMPGANLDLKFFLSVSGGAPPDLLNHDDPVVADWAHRGALMPLDELVDAEQVKRLEAWLFPAARQLGSYNGRLYALCNGLDVRALYYDERALAELGRGPPRTIAELDSLATEIAPPDSPGRRLRYGYLPDPRRIWAWGIVFGGRFYDPASGRVTADSAPIMRALDWMASYSRRYGARNVAAFRKGDQTLTGSAFPLLEGRYAMIMDGQWRVLEIAAAQRAARRRGEDVPEFGVAPLPAPPDGRANAGWVNGNFFVIPRGARNAAGAWAFAKYWAGFGGFESQAARHCAAGGWIPASHEVVSEQAFEEFLAKYPDFATFVELAGSEHQVPTPAVPGAMFFYTEIVRAAEDAMYRGIAPEEVLERATRRVQARLDEVRD